MSSSVADLRAGIRSGDRRSLARAISLVENGEPGADDLLGAIHRETGRAHLVGITGAPGVGKSTLVFRLAQELRKAGTPVGIVAVDPTSPFTGGALLGDRVRMQELATDPGVFIRSMGTRGAAGGLARRTGDVVRILDAAGMQTIIVETIGTGQAEIDVVRLVHTCAVVLAPGMGDEVQAFKAGILEIGDIFVVNKADRDGAERTIADLQSLLETGRHDGWKPPIVRTVASEGTGTTEVLAAIRDHLAHLDRTGGREGKERERLRAEILALVAERLRDAHLTPERRAELDRHLDAILARKLAPRDAVEALLGHGKG